VVFIRKNFDFFFRIFFIFFLNIFEFLRVWDGSDESDGFGTGRTSRTGLISGFPGSGRVGDGLDGSDLTWVFFKFFCPRPCLTGLSTGRV
jgi:hypothetical protein